MTQQLIILGDSLVDSGNTSGLLSPFGQNPFEDAKYNDGGNVKASDGPVLGEFIALEMGATIDDAQLISVLSPALPQPVQVHNYAHAGARTDDSPGFSLPLAGQLIGIGLQEQKRVLTQRKSYYQNQRDVDVLLSCGGNDIRDAFDQTDKIQDVIATETRSDDRKFAYSAAKPIAKNLKKAVNKLVTFTDEIALIGAPPIMETPEAKDWLTNFSGDDQQGAAEIITLIGKKVMHKLEKKYKDIDNVAVIDGAEIWNQLKSPSFVDSVHPDAKTSSEAAKIFFGEATTQLSSFGF